MGNQQGVKKLPQRPQGKRPQAGRRYSLAPCESTGRSDLKSYTASSWRKSTTSEINGHLADGASIVSVPQWNATSGDWSLTQLITASEKEKIVVSGDYTLSNDAATGKKTYTFSGGSGGVMNVYTRADGKTVENADYTSEYIVNYKVSSLSWGATYTGVYYYKNSYGTYTALNNGNSQTYYVNPSYTKSTLTVTGIDTGDGSAQLCFTPKASSGGGGSLTYTPSKAETTAPKYFNYYTYTPSAATEETKTFLVQGSATAVQNFAFDIDDNDL